MTFGSTFGRTFSPSFQPKSQAAVVASSWWLSGGIDAANCVAAYQPKGAASYAASKVNLANAGTYDLTDGTAYPDWDASTGWKGDGASSNGKCLISTIKNPSSDWTLIARYSSAQASNDCLLGFQNYSGGYRYYGLWFYHVAPTQRWCYGINGTYTYGQAATSSGVMAQAGLKAYLNGTEVGDIPSGGAVSSTLPIIILASDASGTYGCAAYMQACAIYNTTLTSTQIGNLTTAMAAL